MYQKRGHPKEYKGFFGRHITLVATSTLVGTIVGAGILGIPYVVSQTGFLYGLILMIVLGLAFILINLFIGEIVLRTKKQYQLTGYANKYLGSSGKFLMTVAMLLTIYGALTAYLIGEGPTLKAIFGVGNPLTYTLIFFTVSVLIIYKGIKATGRAEFMLIGLLILVVALIGIFSYNQITADRLLNLDLKNFFLPYGVILFAYMAAPAIPELQEVLGKKKKEMKKAIIIGSIIPAILYILFTFVVVGIVGAENFSLLAPNERIATVALGIYSLPVLSLFANILAVLGMFTSFLTLGMALVGLYIYDYAVSKPLAFLLTFPIPLAVALLKLTSFITVLGITGSLSGGLEGILIVLMYWKAKKKGDRKPEYKLGKHYFLGSLLLLMFASGIIYQVWINFV